MRPLPFTLRQLEVFDSLCATGSFRRSAESLGISQASVSNQMNALEEQLGLALFVRRRGQGPKLTNVGQAFHDDLRAFQDAGQALAAYRRSYTAAKDRRVRYRILVGHGTLDRYLRPKLDRFFADNPQIELTFETRAPSDELSRDLADGHFDLALVHRLVNAAAEPELRQIALLDGGIYGHRKFAEGQELPLPPELIDKLPFILPTNYPPEDKMLEFYRSHGIRPRHIVSRTQHYDVAMSMMQRGIGVYFLIDAILPPEMREDVIMLRPLENWRLMWFRKDAGQDPRCNAVEAFLMSSVLGDPNYRTISISADSSLRVEWEFARAPGKGEPVSA